MVTISFLYQVSMNMFIVVSFKQDKFEEQKAESRLSSILVSEKTLAGQLQELSQILVELY